METPATSVPRLVFSRCVRSLASLPTSAPPSSLTRSHAQNLNPSFPNPISWTSHLLETLGMLGISIPRSLIRYLGPRTYLRHWGCLESQSLDLGHSAPKPQFRIMDPRAHCETDALDFFGPQLIESSTLKEEVVRGVDIMVIRELTGDVYFGTPKVRISHGRCACEWAPIRRSCARMHGIKMCRLVDHACLKSKRLSAGH
jgi:hypothetical protein